MCHEWNTAVHVQQGESGPSRRAFTVGELETFFDYADGQVEQIRAAGRKGWWPAFRDATLFKVAYAFGLFSGGHQPVARGGTGSSAESYCNTPPGVWCSLSLLV